MSGRIVAALVLAPIACGLVFGAWILWGLDRSGSPGPSLWVAILPGLMYGSLFEVIALLPLLLLRRKGKATITSLVASGVALWAIAVALNIWATSELPLREFTMVFVPLLFPGVALVLVFAFVARSGEAA